MKGKQFVLCFDHEGGAKEEINIEGGGESYMLQFEEGASGETVDGVDGEGKSLVLQFKTSGQGEGEKGGEKGGMMSLLHEWGEEKQGERQTEEEGSQGESYVLHFHAETPGSGPASAAFSQGQETNLQLSCTHNQTLVPLDGQEVVFELGGETKMEQETVEGMQMIALIEGDGMIGDDVAGCNAASGRVTEDGADMGGIFQLESGEEIVIIEVSTSSLREGGDLEISQTSEGLTVEAKEKSAKEHNSTDNTEIPTSAENVSSNGPIHNKEMQF